MRLCYCLTRTLSTRTDNDVSPGKDAVSRLRPERKQINRGLPAPPNRSSEPFRVAIGDTGWNGACQRAMTQIRHKTGARHADTSLWRVGWCWAGGEEIPPPPLTRTVIVSWLLQRRHLLDIWRNALEWPKLINNKQLSILFRHYLTITHRLGSCWTGRKDETRGWKPSWWVLVSRHV